MPIHMIWGTILIALLVVMMYTFPAVVQKSSAEGMGYVMVIGVVLGAIALTTSQVNLPKWIGEQSIKWRYPHADLENYRMGFTRLDEAKMAYELATEATKMPEGFMVNAVPMKWSEALGTKVASEPINSYRQVQQGYNIPYWMITDEQAVNLVMVLISVVGCMTLMLLVPMGSQLACEGERRERLHRS